MADYPQREKYEGQFEGQTVRFNREWAGHRFTDEECEALLNGEEISFEANKKAGGTFRAVGTLGKAEYNGHEYWGFQLRPFEQR